MRQHSCNASTEWVWLVLTSSAQITHKMIESESLRLTENCHVKVIEVRGGERIWLGSEIMDDGLKYI